MAEPDFIAIRGAGEHNLKLVSLDVPKKKLVVFSGVSGSGKSSLAFDTLYAEGQRRYVESLSAYARQFVGQQQPSLHGGHGDGGARLPPGAVRLHRRAALLEMRAAGGPSVGAGHCGR